VKPQTNTFLRSTTALQGPKTWWEAGPPLLFNPVQDSDEQFVSAMGETYQAL
jgi:hypothetical protein